MNHIQSWSDRHQAIALIGGLLVMWMFNFSIVGVVVGVVVLTAIDMIAKNTTSG